MEIKKYPLKLKSAFKGAIWGGNKLNTVFGKTRQVENQAEEWQLTVRNDAMNVIENGPYAGMTLEDYLKKSGSSYSIENFPLLVKYIDAGQKLSIQVHPAKTEMWYIVDADPGAWLIYGQEGSYSEDDLRNGLEEGRLEDMLTKVYVKPGECYFIPTGLTHAIGGGLLISEIQENSNITYRVYDYNRRQADGTLRELHTDKAFKVMKKFTEDEIERIRFSLPCETEFHAVNDSGVKSELLASCDKFTTYRHEICGQLELDCGKRFAHIMCVKGSGTIECGGVSEIISKGESWYIPENSGSFYVNSDSGTEILESFVM